MNNPATTPRRTGLSVSTASGTAATAPAQSCGECQSCIWREPETCEYLPGLVTDYADFKPGHAYQRLRSGVYREVR